MNPSGAIWIGQLFGILTTVMVIVTPLFPKKWHMLVGSMLNNTFTILNLVFLGQIGSGIFLCLVSNVQVVFNLIHTRRETPPARWENILFLVLYLLLGFYGLVTAPGFVPAINGRNLRELLPILGAVMHMCFIFARDENKARFFLLCCTASWAVYTALLLSTAFFGEFFGTVSGVVGILRERKKRAQASPS